MNAGFSRNLDAIDYSNCMVQLCAIPLKPAFHRLSPMGHESVRGWDELHECRYEREKVVPSLMIDLPSAVRNTARLALYGRCDLARMHGIMHERRTEKHGRFTIGIREWRLARPFDTGERRSRGSRPCHS
jgi:hypothetical protein